MAIRLPSHLHRTRSGVLHFRIAIPADLRHHFKTKEIYPSLHTPSVRDATLAAQTLPIDLKRVFTAIRQQIMSIQNKLHFKYKAGRPLFLCAYPVINTIFYFCHDFSSLTALQDVDLGIDTLFHARGQPGRTQGRASVSIDASNKKSSSKKNKIRFSASLASLALVA